MYILGTTSKYRINFFRQIFLDPWRAEGARIDERAYEDVLLKDPVVEGPKFLSLMKGLELVARFGDEDAILTCDQVISVEGKPLHKEPTPDGMLSNILAMSGKEVMSSTGVTILSNASGGELVRVGGQSFVFTEVMKMRKISPWEAMEYIQTCNPSDCAGSLRISEPVVQSWVTNLGEIKDPTSLLGFPLQEIWWKIGSQANLAPLRVAVEISESLRKG